MKRRRPPFRQLIRYRLDNIVSAGTIALVAWLGVLTVALILVAGFVLAVFDIATGSTEHPSLIEGAWLSLLRTLDPGTMGGDLGWPFRIVSLVVTLGGIFIVSVLIGLVTTGIDRKLEDLRKGKTLVLETGHTLILGWSPKIDGLIAELAIANENQASSSIVIMAAKDKVEMEDEIRRVVDTNLVGKGMRVVCRTGEPADPRDLEIVAPGDAKSIVVLSSETPGGDAHVMKTLLAIRKVAPASGEKVVAEFMDHRSASAVRRATAGRVRTVVSSELIARITAQICRLPGLSAVYIDLLDFGGDEIYFAEPGPAAGRTFGEALMMFPDSTPLGIRHEEGSVAILPGMETVLGPRDRLVAIAKDDDKVVAGEVADPGPADAAGERVAHRDIVPARFLIIGWSDIAPVILKELDRYFAPGSHATVLFDPTRGGETDPRRVADLRNFQVEVRTSHATDLETIDELLRGSDTDHVMVLCYRQGATLQEAEAWTLMTLLHVRSILEDDEREDLVGVVTELLDVRDVELATTAEGIEFVVSERLTALMMAQLSENAELDEVFEELFDGEGAEITLRPASSYVPTGVEIPYTAAVVAARVRGEIALGFRISRDGEDEVALNPAKSRTLVFTERDQLIVLGELISS